MYRQMLTIRHFDESAAEGYLKRAIPGLVHTYIGQEAVAVGVCANLKIDDCIVSNHRGHGHCIAKGADLRRMMAELYGKKTGYCKGKGGSMHIADFSIGMLGANGIVGAGLPIAIGAALAAQLERGNRVAVCFFGDGATQEGEFHESLNLASIWKLPIVFVCENNLYGVNTPAQYAIPLRDIADRAAAYAMPGIVVDGNDVIAVYEATRQAVKRIQTGGGPTLLECKTYRWDAHHEGAPVDLRPADEIDAWKKKCPLASFEVRLLEEEIMTQQDLDEVDKQVRAQIEDAIKYAIESPLPDPADALEGVFSD
ncbi:MAG: thiamine pyrophosphate-dependent dehydrogenase E1 component subunit alpha [Pseudomonadota bacterium]